MIRRNPENDAALDRLKAAFPQPKKGTLIAWADIEAAMGRHRTDRGGWTIIRRFRAWLSSRTIRITTYPVPNSGLHLLADRDAVREVPRYRQTRVAGQHRRQNREQRTINREALSARERAILDVQQHNLREIRKANRRSQRALATFLREKDVRPTPIPAPDVQPRPEPKYKPRETPPRLPPTL